MKLKYSIGLSLFLLSIMFPTVSFGFSVNFNGQQRNIIKITPEKNTGLDALFVVYNIKEINRIIITGVNGTEIEVERYSNLGGGYAEEVPFSFSNGELIINNPEGDIGYIIKTESGNFCFWITNYASDPLQLEEISLDTEQECESTRLHIGGKGEEIHYFTIDGRMRVLSRNITLSYTTLEWNEENSNYIQVEEEKILSSISGRVILTPPLYCNTTVKVSGDRFLREWGLEQEIESGIFYPYSVSVNSRAEQVSDEEEGSNVIKSETDGLGGSAPADISFFGYVTDGVLHTEWQMASDPDFEDILFRFNDQDVSYSFTEEGRYYMRFIGSNADGSCESVGDTYTISIGSSDLRIPNAFSPNNDGVNDVWKVGYRSLIEFKCWIFDSKGRQLYEFDNPSDGWDGTHRGKIVQPGVYYYVIQATGADGKKYKRSGDINILNYKKYGSSTADKEE